MQYFRNKSYGKCGSNIIFAMIKFTFLTNNNPTMTNNSESIEELYNRKFNWMPNNVGSEMGHFNVFRLEVGHNTKNAPLPYKKRDYYKITTLVGESKIHYADKVIEIDKQSLVFTNPQIPYRWEHTQSIKNGFYCIFNQRFFHDYTGFSRYEVFQPGGIHVFELSDEQLTYAYTLYLRMIDEINSDYKYKYDSIRLLVLELMHFGMKLQPNERIVYRHRCASDRIASLFVELLERQFPIDEMHPKINLRSPSDFALHLSVHVNHLNRAVKENTGKTTTEVILERILQEAKLLLKQGEWNVSEIAYGLGFSETAHFINFFKSHVGLSPLQFRELVATKLTL